MSKYTNWEKFYQKLNIIFHGIIASTLIPFAWVFLETQKEHPDGPLLGGTVAMVINVLLVTVCAVLIGWVQFLSKKSIRKVHEEESVKAKLDLYLKEKMVLYALLEGSAFLALVGLYLSKEPLFTVIYLVVLFVFSLQRPSFDRVSRETGIRQNDLKTWGEGDE